MLLHPKKVGTLPVANSDEEKQTNEIRMAAPLLESLDLDGVTITADALLTQRKLARFLVEDKQAHYHFSVKGNQKNLLKAIELAFQQRDPIPAYANTDMGHGRIETRKIWTTKKLNHYLDFPHVRQAFVIERQVIHKKSNKTTTEVAYGITSKDTYEASPVDILKTNRNHWCIENSCHHILDWVYDEDRCRIRTGNGPQNMTCLRRLAISTIKRVSKKGVAETTRQLAMNTRLVFDYFKMTDNSRSGAAFCVRTN